MAKTMSASKPITTGQIENLVDKLRAAVRKHRAEITAQAAQQILGVENLGMELYEVIRKRVEMLANFIVRHVTVDRSRTPQQVLDATGRRQYTDHTVVATMPHGEGSQKTVFFFKPAPEEYDHDGWMSDEALERAHERRHLISADPYSQAQVNTDDPVFADTHPNGTHWKDANGNWCFASFSGWRGEHSVVVNRLDDRWRDDWWFAGVPK